MKSIFILTLLFSVLQVFSQESKPQNHLYVKLENPINNESKVLSLKKDFQIAFNREEKISKLLNSNIYKVSYNLPRNEVHNLLTSLEKLEGFIYYDLISTEPIAPPNDIPPTTPSFLDQQSYLNPNPGVNAIYAWGVGADGNGINIRVLEYGLNTNHEEFEHKNASIANGYTINLNTPESYAEHGTATAGIIFSDDGSYGTTGIAFNANEYVLYPEWTQEYDYNRVQAVTNAINNSSQGDVIIYEMQDTNGAPAEVDSLIWDLTKVATDNGIVVVAAAGNGGINLDSTDYTNYVNLGDSGAIIVGAGQSDLSHNALSFSTYGSRVNVQGWHGGFTTGDYGYSTLIDNDFNQSYTNFSGTSSATAMVGGCVVALQSYYFGLTGTYLTSDEIRGLLIDTGFPQGFGGHIGPFPNLEEAINSINQILNLSSHNQLNYSIYPNPVKNELIIQQPYLSSYKISIINVIGAEVYRGQFNQKKIIIDLSSLKNGVYIVTIFNDKGFKKQKIIKS